MKLPKLTALLLLAFFFFGCDKDDTEPETFYERTGLPVSAAQNVPTLPTTGTGTLDINYNSSAKLLSYTIRWDNLTDSVIAIRICGPAPKGFNNLNLAFNPSSSAFTNPATTPHIFKQELVGTATKSLYPKTGSYSSTLFVDGVKVREEDLLNNFYYFTIHTKTIIPPLPPTTAAQFAYRWFGEIRGQIEINN